MIREARSSGPLSGHMRVPGSKSLTNRALVCASLATGTSLLTGASESDDTALMVNGLNQFGILVLMKGTDLEVRGGGGVLHAPKFPIPCGNAGTTLRFLIALSALARGTTSIETSPRGSLSASKVGGVGSAGVSTTGPGAATGTGLPIRALKPRPSFRGFAFVVWLLFGIVGSPILITLPSAAVVCWR